MIQISNLSKSFSDQILFENISFNLQKGERCGLVGRNGSGKSTIFSMILGKQLADGGNISIPKGYKIGSLEQHIQFTKPTVLEECVQVLPEEQQFDFHLANKILFGLGFTDEDLQKNPNSFSGGYQIRINLCKCLLIEPNLLLLDEPTNYLDILSLRWLRSFLRSFTGEVILITHDRAFMDSVTTHTMGITRSTLKKIKGSTNKFYEQLELEDEIYLKTKVNVDKKKAHLEAFVDRFSAKASKAAQAQSKLKQLNKLESMDDLKDEASMGLQFNYKECPGKTILELNNISFGFKEDEILFKDLTLSVGKKDRIGIIGKNGKGKSTLLNVMNGELDTLSGTIKTHPSIQTGHFGQTNIDRLHGSNTVINEIQSANDALSSTAIRNIAGSLMFSSDLAKKKISVLSGGEKNRVLLGKIIANETNILMLDEPTNHLDMESIEILADELINYPGAITLVTHNESLLKNLCTKLIIFHKGIAEVFLGNYTEFLEKIGWEEENLNKESKEEKPTLSKKEIHARRAEIIKERARTCNPIQKKIDVHEKLISDYEKEMDEQTKIIAEATEAADNDKIMDASMKIGKLETQINSAFEELEVFEMEFLELSEKFDKQLSDIHEN